MQHLPSTIQVLSLVLMPVSRAVQLARQHRLPTLTVPASDLEALQEAPAQHLAAKALQRNRQALAEQGLQVQAVQVRII